MLSLLKKFFSKPQKIDLDPGALPKHVAIITDGNGRWAKRRGLPRTAGHKAGIKRVREVIRVADRLGIKHLTFYSFSTENWKRPQTEVDFLMRLPIEYLKTDIAELVARNVRVNIIGDIVKTPGPTLAALTEFKEQTKHNIGLNVNFAVNYGSRDEIITAVRNIASAVADAKLMSDDIDDEVISRNLFTAGMPDPDLLIRTSGELRISNFMLWQIAYSELWFTDILWPDFTEEVFLQALRDFTDRARRFGTI